MILVPYHLTKQFKESSDTDVTIEFQCTRSIKKPIKKTI